MYLEEEMMAEETVNLWWGWLGLMSDDLYIVFLNSGKVTELNWPPPSLRKDASFSIQPFSPLSLSLSLPTLSLVLSPLRSIGEGWVSGGYSSLPLRQMGKPGKPSPPLSPEVDLEKGQHRHHHRHQKHQCPSPQYLPPPPPPPAPEQWFPWLIPLIFVANVAVFAYTMYVNDCPSREGDSCTLYPLLRRFSFEPFKYNPMLGPSIST